MHDHAHLPVTLQNGLAAFYFLVALMNAAYAYSLRKQAPGEVGGILDRSTTAWGMVRGLKPLAVLFSQWWVWAAAAGIFLIHSLAYLLHLNWIIPDAAIFIVNAAMNPVSYFVIACILFAWMLWWREFFVEPGIAWLILNLSLFCSGWSMTNATFKDIITKPDNVPIVMLIFSVGYLTWLAMYLAVINDDRMARGEPPMEKLGQEKVLVWPDLVYTELISMVICTLILVVWAILLKAPLEQPASTAKIPNPSKAPWYFLGLQEMLVYYDPWMAGVVLPTFIVQGLIALPYIDYNQKGNGYYTFVQRAFAITTFLFGFIVLWVVLIVLGTFLRGPNWNFFGPFEPWDSHKNVPLNNVNLSDYFWLMGLGQSVEGKHWLIRELPGILLVIGYLALLPPILAKTIMRPFFVRMGFVRFMVLVTLIQFMACLPIKMVLRWTINLKYIVFIPELFFNI